jgi:hypothetical protein
MVIFIIILFYFGYNDINIEHLALDSHIKDKIGKELYLKFANTTIDPQNPDIEIINDYYLAITPKKRCDNILEGDLTSFECSNNVAILQKQPNEFCRFILTPSLIGDVQRYKLNSILNTEKGGVFPEYANMDQRLNIYGVKGHENRVGNIPVCFDDDGYGEEDDPIYFELEENNSKNVRLVYRKAKDENVDTPVYENFYISKCFGLDCEQGLSAPLLRLCLTADKSKSIYFNIEIASDQPKIEKPIEIDISQEYINEEEEYHDSMIAQEGEEDKYLDIYSLDSLDEKSINSIDSEPYGVEGYREYMLTNNTVY